MKVCAPHSLSSGMARHVCCTADGEQLIGALQPGQPDGVDEAGGQHGHVEEVCRLGRRAV